MTRGKLLVAVGVTALALSATPAWAQRGSAERADPDSRGSGPDRSGGTGSAVDRSSPSSPSSSGSSGTSSGSSSSGSSGGGWSAPSTSPSSSGSSEYVSAPVRPNRNADRETAQSGRPRGGNGGGPRGGDGGGGSARAVPRGSDTSGGSGGSRSASAGSDNGDSPSRNAVPTYSRPRPNGGTGVAVDRGYPVSDTRPYSYYYYPSYSNYYSRYYFPGYAFGLGAFYDPGWYDPYYYGGYYGGGSGYYGGGSGYYGGGYQGGYGSSSYGRGPTGSLRLKIKPREAQVYVDGYFVGVVDDFDGVFQRLGVDAGGHRIEIRSPGHETISFDVLITPNETVTYKGELRHQ